MPNLHVAQELQTKQPKQESQLEAEFAQWWRLLAPSGIAAPEREVRLIAGRKWRCDFVWSASRVVVEINGGQYQARGGRHNTDADREKVNALVQAGWKVFQYSGSMLKNDPAAVIKQVASAVMGLKG